MLSRNVKDRKKNKQLETNQMSIVKSGCHFTSLKITLKYKTRVQTSRPDVNREAAIIHQSKSLVTLNCYFKTKLHLFAFAFVRKIHCSLYQGLNVFSSTTHSQPKTEQLSPNMAKKSQESIKPVP